MRFVYQQLLNLSEPSVAEALLAHPAQVVLIQVGIFYAQRKLNFQVSPVVGACKQNMYSSTHGCAPRSWLSYHLTVVAPAIPLVPPPPPLP